MGARPWPTTSASAAELEEGRPWQARGPTTRRVRHAVSATPSRSTWTRHLAVASTSGGGSSRHSGFQIRSERPRRGGWQTSAGERSAPARPLTSPGGGAGHTTGGSPRPRPPHSTSPARRSEPVHHQDRLGMGRGPRTIATQGSRPVGRRVARNPDNTSDPPAAFREESPSPILMHSSHPAEDTVPRHGSRAITLRWGKFHRRPDRLRAPRIAGRVTPGLISTEGPVSA